VRLALKDGGIEKVSDLKELTFDDLGLLKYTPSVVASTCRIGQQALEYTATKKVIIDSSLVSRTGCARTIYMVRFDS
jgi:hypothetical protein